MMNNLTPLKRKTTLSLVASILIFSMLAGMLSACNMIIVTPIPTEDMELTPSQGLPATQELTLVSPTEVLTELAPVEVIKINIDKVIYPPLSNVKENFEKGEYDASVEIIKRWINVWGKMGVFDEIGNIYDNGLVLIPLVGGEKVSCVALKSDKYAKTLYCPPIDNVVGGLKIFSDSGQVQGTDKPIIVNLIGTEGLTIRGKGNELTYQIADKYTNKGIRYYDINTKGFVEGSFVAPLEVKENDPIEGSVVCVADEFCMDGQMKIDEEVAVKFYDRFMNALVNNEENREYFDQLLSGNISQESLKKYLIESDGIVPPGLKLMKNARDDYFRMNYRLDKEISLKALKVITFGPIEWKNNVGNIQEYINNADRVGLTDPYSGLGVSIFYYGWFVDRSGYIVLVSGSKDFESNINEGRVDDPFAVIGGKDGKYIPERDNMIATATFLSWVNFMEFSEKGNAYLVAPLGNIQGGQAGVTYQDVENFSGNRTLFVK